MKKHIFFHRLLIFIISVAMIFTLTSCTQQKKPVPSTTKSQDENKPPKELDELNKAVEKLEKTLSDMYERSKKPLFIQQEELKKQQEKQAQGGQGQQDQQQGGGGGEGSEQGGGSSSGGQQQGQQATPVELVTPKDKLLALQYENEQAKADIEKANLKQFEQLSKDVLELHSLWNAYESKALTQLAIQTAIKDFEDSLNNLTKSVSSRDVYQSLMDATQLYKYLPDFYATYTAESPPEIGKIRFAAKKIHLLGEKANFTAAKDTLDYLTNIWMLMRPKLSQDNMDMINQIEFASSDLKSAIEDKNNIVIKAKTEVIIKVADELEKASKKEQK